MSAALTRVVVTGGAGFLGNYVVARLLDRGVEVLCIDDLSGGTAVAHGLAQRSGFRHEPVDITDRQQVVGAFSSFKPQAVVHLAALHFIPACIANPSLALSTNVLGTQHVLDACGEHGPTRVLFASTADTYTPSATPHDEEAPQRPDNVYGLSKLCGEQLVDFAARQDRVDPVVVRLFNLFGPGETNPHVIPEIVEQLKRGDVLRLGNTSPRRDYVFVDDAAQTIVELLFEAPGGTVVNVGTGSSYSVDEVIQRIREATGRDITVETDPSRFRPTDRPNLQANNQRLRSTLPGIGFRSLDEGLRVLLDHEGLG